METKNAKIKSTFLGTEDHGIFTANLTLDYGGGGFQDFGSHELKYEKYGIEYLERILKTLGIESWEDLPGTVCRVKADRRHVEAIGHFIEDKWFNPEKDLDDAKTQEISNQETA